MRHYGVATGAANRERLRRTPESWPIVGLLRLRLPVAGVQLALA